MHLEDVIREIKGVKTKMAILFTKMFIQIRK